MKDIILVSDFFEVDVELDKLLKKQGYKDIMEIKARLDEDVIKYVKTKLQFAKGFEKQVYVGATKAGYLEIAKVDTNRRWFIQFDPLVDAEWIQYLDKVDEELNYYEIHYDEENFNVEQDVAIEIKSQPSPLSRSTFERISNKLVEDSYLYLQGKKL